MTRWLTWSEAGVLGSLRKTAAVSLCPRSPRPGRRGHLLVHSAFAWYPLGAWHRLDIGKAERNEAQCPPSGHRSLQGPRQTRGQTGPCATGGAS